MIALLKGWGVFILIAAPAICLGMGIAVLFFRWADRWLNAERPDGVILIAWMVVGLTIIGPIMVGGLMLAIHFASLTATGYSMIGGAIR